MFNIKITGSAKKALDKLKAKAENLSDAVGEATLYMERETKLNFAQESDPDDVPWAPLMPSTLRSKRTSSILRETSTGANSVASEASGFRGRVYISTGYMLYHQTGTRKMAQRKVIGIGARHQKDILKIFERHLAL